MKFSKFIILLLALAFILSGCSNNADVSSVKANPSENISADTFQSDILREESKKEDTSTDSNSSKPVNSQSNSEIKDTSSVTSSKPDRKTVKTKGIDVSRWQSKIDWKKVKSSGVDFAIIRIGQRGENGKIVKDDCADYNIQQADKNGILIGVYYFSTAKTLDEALEDAKWVANAIKSYPVSYPVVWDCEGFSESNSRMYTLTNAQRTDIAIAFLNKIKSLGYDVMFYGAQKELENSFKWDTLRIEQNYKIWLASYPDITYPQIKFPDYQGRCDMWQYTNKGSVSGIKGDVDLVVSYFFPKKSAPKSSEKPPIASEPQENDGYTAVNVKVTAKDTVNLRDSASTKGKIIGTLKNGDIATKIADGINGWSKLVYGGKTGFAISSYLTEDLSYKSPKEEHSDGFKTVNQTVTAKDKTNLRSVPNSSDDSTIVYTLKNGETAKRVGISDNGWSKLEYKGKTLYAVSSFLTTDLNYKTPVNSEQNTSSQFKTVFKDVTQKVTAKSETNLRSRPSVTDSEIIYTLKNGEYVTCTGISDNGWSRLEYAGKTVYAVSSYLIK